MRDELWEDRIRKALAFRRKAAWEDRWESWLKQYRVDFPRNIVAVPVAYAYLRTMLPRIYFRNPRVMVTPRRPEYIAHAIVVEAVDNWLIDELGLKQEMKLAVLDALLFGYGVLKIGYDSKFGFIPEQAVEEDYETVSQVGSKGGRVEYAVKVKPGMPWALRVHPRDVVFPAGWTRRDDVPWIAHRVVRPLADVVEDMKYYRKARGELAKKVSKDDEDVLVELWEVRDFKNRTIKVLCEGIVLLEEEDVLQIEDLPFVFIVFNEDPESPYGISDMRVIDLQQQEMNDVRTQIQQHRRLSLLKLLARKGAIDEEEVAKLLSGEMPTVVWTESEPGVAIQPLQHQIPPSLRQELEFIRADMREALGYNINVAGEFIPRTKTATEVLTVQQAVNLRVDERRDVVADALSNVVRKWNQLIFKFWTDRKVIKVVGVKPGTEAWVTYTGEELRGEYFLSVNPESSIPPTRALRYQQAMQLFQALNGDPLIDQVLLRRMALRQFEWLGPEAMALIKPEAQEQPMAPKLASVLSQASPGRPPMEEPETDIRGGQGAVREWLGEFT